MAPRPSGAASDNLSHGPAVENFHLVHLSDLRVQGTLKRTREWAAMVNRRLEKSGSGCRWMNAKDWAALMERRAA